MENRIAALAILLATFTSSRAWADAEECQSAINYYNSVTGDISDYLKRYANCIGGSQGRDDCNFEFRKLKSAQDDFESALSGYQSNCD